MPSAERERLTVERVAAEAVREGDLVWMHGAFRPVSTAMPLDEVTGRIALTFEAEESHTGLFGATLEPGSSVLCAPAPASPAPHPDAIEALARFLKTEVFEEGEVEAREHAEEILRVLAPWLRGASAVLVGGDGEDTRLRDGLAAAHTRLAGGDASGAQQVLEVVLAGGDVPDLPEAVGGDGLVELLTSEPTRAFATATLDEWDQSQKHHPIIDGARLNNDLMASFLLERLVARLSSTEQEAGS